MWHQIKIPFRPPRSKLYELQGDNKRVDRGFQYLSPQIEAIYPKLIRQIAILKNKLTLSVSKTKELEDEKVQLNQNIHKLETQSTELKDQTEHLKDEIKLLRNEIEELHKRPLPSEGGEGGSEYEETISEEHIFANIRKEYVDTQEKMLNEHGQPGEIYR